MRKGPAPKPTALKMIQGNPGKRPVNQSEPSMDPRMPHCPEHLSDEAKREWKRIAKRLQKAGVMTFVDKAALAVYCQSWGRWVEAEQDLVPQSLVLTSDKGNDYRNPRLDIARQAMKDMMDAAREFGMTPASRTKIRVEKGEEKLSLAEELFAIVNG